MTGAVADTSAMRSSYAPAPGHRFNVGDRVAVKSVFPPGHRRTPWYIRGKHGVIERICGAFPNPEELAYGFDGEPAKGEIRAVAFSLDGGALVTVTLDNTTRVWNVATGHENVVFRQPDRIRAAALSSDGRTLITAWLDKTARI